MWGRRAGLSTLAGGRRPGDDHAGRAQQPVVNLVALLNDREHRVGRRVGVGLGRHGLVDRSLAALPGLAPVASVAPYTLAPGVSFSTLRPRYARTRSKTSGAVGIEIPNEHPQVVYLKDTLAAAARRVAAE